MKNKQFEAKFKDRGAGVTIALTLFTFEEDGVYFTYSPALEITGYGKSEEESDESFKITMAEFLKYTVNKNTFKSELKRLGWTVSNNTKKPKVKAPTMSELLRDNEYLNDILNNPSHKTKETEVLIPA